MTHHRYDRRTPKRTGGFSWGRFPTSSHALVPGVEWRLFRRDLTGRLHAGLHLFPIETERSAIAQALLIHRRELREKVDAIGYALIEAEQASQLQEVA